MALNFPDSPTLNQEVTLAGKTYKWDGVKWLFLKVIEEATAPTITIISEDPDGVTFTLTNNDDNTAIISYDIDTTQGAVELATTATSSNITVALAEGTYTLTAYATVVGEVATSATASVEIVIPNFTLLYDSNVSATLPLTQIDITGLNITKDDELKIVFTLVGDSSSASTLCSLFVNDITTNYARQQLSGISTTISAARDTVNLWAAASSIGKNMNISTIKISNNDKFVVQSNNTSSVGSQSSSIGQIIRNIVNTGTITSITKLSIVSDRTNGIASGSRIRLYKVNTGAA
jgi:hypothetical protein